jgi:hypothetical protein
MRTISIKVGSVLLAVVLLATTLTQPLSAFSANPGAIACTCDPPFDLSIAGISSNDVSFSWSSNEQGASYKVWYYREEDNFTSTERITGNLHIEYTGLPAGTYTFYFATVCEGGTSQSIIVDDLIML